MKAVLYGSTEQEPQQDVIVQLSQEIYNAGLLHTLIQSLPRIDFEVCILKRFQAFQWISLFSEKHSVCEFLVIV